MFEVFPSPSCLYAVVPHSAWPLQTIWNPLKVMGTQVSFLFWPEVRRRLGFPAEEVQDSSWQTSWALSTRFSGPAEGYCSQPALTVTANLQTDRGSPLSLPRYGVWEGNLGCSNTIPQVKHFCGSDSMCAFLFLTTKDSTLTLKLKQPRRGIFPPHPKNEINMNCGNPVHNHGSYLCNICITFTFSSHRRTQKVKSWLKSTGTTWILGKANSRSSVSSLK